MTVLATSTPLNATAAAVAAAHISAHDTNGSILYIVGVLVWYAIGFSLILIDDIDPHAGYDHSHNHTGVYQTVSALHDEEDLNDILHELKDKDRRTRLWQIYYGTQNTLPAAEQKEKQAIELIVKQLNDLNDRRRFLRRTLNEISVDQPDDFDDSDSGSVQWIRKSKSSEQLRKFHK